ncbi:MAG TPA: NAD(P)H-binding protein, partial [Actinomycetes bacterium]|nr:NAD(P)H-binding protein [Actinomycetes bacterium]
MEPTTQQPTLVLGGTGKTGRRVVQRLEARGLPVRIGTPSSVPSFDWNDPATWPSALDGVGSVYLTYYPDLAVPGAAEAIGTFADLAVARGVRRLVLLSGRGEEAARRSEQALVQSGADWTIVRSAFMFQNFNESFFLEPVRAGEVAFPAGEDLAEPFIDADDIADIAVAALTDDRHVGQLYEVTGPRLLTFAAGRLGDLLDRLREREEPGAGHLVELADVPVVGERRDRDVGDVVGV